MEAVYRHTKEVVLMDDRKKGEVKLAALHALKIVKVQAAAIWK